MKNRKRSKLHRVTRSIMGLFGPSEQNITRANHKEEYYKQYFFTRKLCEGIEIVAEVNHISKKKAADLLMRAGFSSYMGDKVTQYIESERIAREQGQKIKVTRIVMILRRYARQHGMDISKFI